MLINVGSKGRIKSKRERSKIILMLRRPWVNGLVRVKMQNKKQVVMEQMELK